MIPIVRNMLESLTAVNAIVLGYFLDTESQKLYEAAIEKGIDLNDISLCHDAEKLTAVMAIYAELKDKEVQHDAETDVSDGAETDS